MLRPFFTFYGGKWRVAKRYPPPDKSIIVEPFAGSAGYSLRYPDKQVVLVDSDPVIAGVWKYIISAKESEIRRLPLNFEHIDDLSVPDEAKWLIGFWLNKGTVAPSKSPSAWMRAGTHKTSFWGEAIRERIASQQQYVRHWAILNESYHTVPNLYATWFIDPPYSTQSGRYYRMSDINYTELSSWCKTRAGQTIVCEQEGANWLDFQPFMKIKSNESSRGKSVSSEVIWTNLKEVE